MVAIHVNQRNNGACSSCVNFNKCSIVKEIQKAASSKINSTYDDTMEMVIYRCPEYTEK